MNFDTENEIHGKKCMILYGKNHRRGNLLVEMISSCEMSSFRFLGRYFSTLQLNNWLNYQTELQTIDIPWQISWIRHIFRIFLKLQPTSQSCALNYNCQVNSFRAQRNSHGDSSATCRKFTNISFKMKKKLNLMKDKKKFSIDRNNEQVLTSSISFVKRIYH